MANGTTYRATSRNNPNTVIKGLTEEKKAERESHFLTRGKWTYEVETEAAPPPIESTNLDTKSKQTKVKNIVSKPVVNNKVEEQKAEESKEDNLK